MKVFGEKLENINYRVRPGVYGIAIKDKKVAVIQLPHGDFLPGGGIEKGETEEECLRRELIEETGFSIDIYDKICKNTQFGLSYRRKEYLKLVGSFYIIELKEMVEMKVEEDHELMWKSLEEVKKSMRLEFQLDAIIKAFERK